MQINKIQQNDFFKSSLRVITLMLVSLIAWMLIAFLFALMDFDPLHDTDSIAYWSASQKPIEYRPLELPAYPVAIATMRVFTGSPVEAFAYAISLFSYLGGTLGIYVILVKTDFPFPLVGALLFAFYPLEGVTVSVYPRVNAFLYFWMIVSLVLYIRRNRWLTLGALVITLFTHKSAWPFVAMLASVGVYEKRWQWWAVVLVPIPLVIYWLAGITVHGDLMWLLDTSSDIKFASDSYIPIFPGLITTFLNGVQGELADLIKGILIVGGFVLALCVLASRVWVERKWLLACLMSILIWPVILNESEIWSAYSYSHLLLLPLLFWVQDKYVNSESAPRYFCLVVLAFLAFSQIAWAVYVVRITA